MNEKVEVECSCGHKGYLLVVPMGDGQIEFNFRTDKRKKWDGVVVDKEDVKKILELINNQDEKD